MKYILSILLSFVVSTAFAASSQNPPGVQQSGTVTPNHAAKWFTNRVIGDAGGVALLGVTPPNGTYPCANVTVTNGNFSFAPGSCGAGAGNMVGSGSTTSGNLLLSNNSGAMLTTARDAGVTFSIGAAANTIPEAGSGGTLSPAWLPLGTTSAAGALEVGGGLSVASGVVQVAPLSPIMHEWVSSISAGGIPQLTQPAFTDISGPLPFTQLSTLGAFTTGSLHVLSNPTSSLASPSDTTLLAGANVTLTCSGASCTIASTGGTAVVFTGTTAGAANAQTIASPSPAGFTLVDQNVIQFKVGGGLANTASAPTLSVNGTTAAPMDVQSGGSLVGLPKGYLQPNQQYYATYQSGCSCYVVTTISNRTIVTVTSNIAPTAAQWAVSDVINLNAANIQVTPPLSTTLSPLGGLVINAINAGTVTATSPDTITTSAGTTGAGGTITLSPGSITIVTTDGAGHLYAAGNGVAVVWPANSNLVVSNTTNNPAGLAPVNNDLVYATGGAFAELASANNAVLVTNGTGVPSLSTTLPSALTVPAPTVSGAAAFTGVPTFTGLSSGTQVSCLGLNSSNSLVIATGACAAGGSVTWPATNDMVISNGTNTPAGLAPANNDLVYSTGGSFANLVTANNAVLATNASGVPSLATTLPSGLTIPAPIISGAAAFTGVPTFSGLSTGTQVSCLGLTSGNVLVTSSAACGSGGGGSLSVTDGTNTETSVTTLQFGVGFLVSSSGSGNATVSPTTTVDAQSGSTYTLVAADGGKLVSMSFNGATTLSIPDTTTTGFSLGFGTSVCASQLTTITLAAVASATVNGQASSAIVISPRECVNINTDNVLTNNYILTRADSVAVDYPVSWVAGQNPSLAVAFRANRPMLLVSTVGDIEASLSGSGDTVKAYIVAAGSPCSSSGTAVFASSGSFNANGSTTSEQSLALANTAGYSGIVIAASSRLCVITAGTDWSGGAGVASLHFYAKVL